MIDWRWWLRVRDKIFDATRPYWKDGVEYFPTREKLNHMRHMHAFVYTRLREQGKREGRRIVA